MLSVCLYSVHVYIVLYVCMPCHAMPSTANQDRRPQARQIHQMNRSDRGLCSLVRMDSVAYTQMSVKSCQTAAKPGPPTYIILLPRGHRSRSPFFKVSHSFCTWISIAFRSLVLRRRVNHFVRRYSTNRTVVLSTYRVFSPFYGIIVSGCNPLFIVSIGGAFSFRWTAQHCIAAQRNVHENRRPPPFHTKRCTVGRIAYLHSLWRLLHLIVCTHKKKTGSGSAVLFACSICIFLLNFMIVIWTYLPTYIIDA